MSRGPSAIFTTMVVAPVLVIMVACPLLPAAPHQQAAALSRVLGLPETRLIDMVER